MVNRIQIPPQESGVIRVFALSLSAADAANIRQDESGIMIGALLGGDAVIQGKAELFPVADLAGLGLADYLIDGQGAEAEQVNIDRVKLNALDGWVLILRSGAFGEGEAILAPDRNLTLIGAYTEPGTDWRSGRNLVSEAATGSDAKARTDGPSAAAMSGRVATAALILIALFTILIVWIAS